jgi:hypothetical protein
MLITDSLPTLAIRLFFRTCQTGNFGVYKYLLSINVNSDLFSGLAM